MIGSSTLALCHLASGAADAYYQFGLHCWDLAAATVIIREAGGTVIDTSGEQNALAFPLTLGGLPLSGCLRAAYVTSVPVALPHF